MQCSQLLGTLKSSSERVIACSQQGLERSLKTMHSGYISLEHPMISQQGILFSQKLFDIGFPPSLEEAQKTTKLSGKRTDNN